MALMHAADRTSGVESRYLPLRQAAMRICRLTDSRACLVGLFTYRPGGATFLAACGFGVDTLAGTHAALAPLALRSGALSGQEACQRVLRSLQAEPGLSLLSVPLSANGKALGVIWVIGKRSASGFNPRDETIAIRTGTVAAQRYLQWGSRRFRATRKGCH